MRNDLRDKVAVDVRSRVLAACVRQAQAPGGLPLEMLVNDTLYHERKRLEAHHGAPGHAADVAFWERVRSNLGRLGEDAVRELLAEIIGRYVDEVCGNFSERVYGLATGVLPRALPLLLNAMSPLRLIEQRDMPAIDETIRLQGHLDALRRCQELGTIVLAPTHVSNLDSPVIGWAVYAAGLPPFTYGAGLNLFTNPVLSFFMRNLGAYRVDRLKKAPLYKDVLKEYATSSLAHGQSNLFFPAGTRVRSGAVEQHLKLGLLSAGLGAYIDNLQRGRPRPNIYVVPCTLNYHLVLEAATLIDDHLQAVGRSRYIITDDESSRPRQILRFMRNLVNLDSRITVTFGEPLDPFGNRVDEGGRSLDDRGREIDIKRYVAGAGGQAVHAPQRDRVFTQEAGEAVARSFKRHNVVLSTNLVAFALFERLRRTHPQMDLYRLLRTAGDGSGVELGELADDVRRILAAARRLADRGEVRIDDAITGRPPSRIVADALRHFGSYHSRPVVQRRGDRLFAGDMNLLLYYRNRLLGYGLEAAPTAPVSAGSHGEEVA